MYWMQVSGYAHGVVNAFDAFCLNIATADRLMHLFFCHENGKLIEVIDYTVRFCFFLLCGTTIIPIMICHFIILNCRF